MPGQQHELVQRWLDYLAGRNRSINTIQSYASVMRHFVAVVGDPIDATVDDAQRWWATQEHLTPPGKARTLSTVRSFYTWAIRHDLVIRSPIRRLDAPSLGRRLPRPVNRHDWQLILEQTTDPVLRRAVCLAAYAGMRIGEVATIDWSHIDTDARRIYIRGKGDHDRVIGLSTLLLDELLPNAGGNIVTAGGEPYTPNGLQRLVNRHLAALGVDGTCHKLRARFATQALAHTGNLLAVSRALGHSSPSATARYAATADTDLDLIAEAATR